MRSVIYNHLAGIKDQFGTIQLVPHLPWEDNGAPLYHHNKKHIYVDTSQTAQEPAFDTLDLGGAVNEVVSVNVYFVCDAKKLPSNYDEVVDLVKTARLAAGTEGYIQKLVQVSSEYQEDAIITTFEFSFRKLIRN